MKLPYVLKFFYHKIFPELLATGVWWGGGGGGEGRRVKNSKPYKYNFFFYILIFSLNFPNFRLNFAFSGVLL